MGEKRPLIPVWQREEVGGKRPFGEYRGAKPQTNPAVSDRGFTGHKHNDSLGLVYMNARYYVPSIGRFASADTLVPDPMNPQQFNRYTYSLNSPVNFSDPTGHIACDSNYLMGQDQAACANNDYLYPSGSAEVTLLAFNIILYATDNEQMLAYGANGIDSLPNMNQGQTIVALATQDTSQILEAHNGDASDALYTYTTVARLAEATAYMVLQAGIRMAGGTPFGQPLPSGGCSFSADTLVMTDDGLIPIALVDVGEQVLAYNEITGEVDYYPVLAMWSHEDPIIVYLTIDGEVIETTPEHPFYTAKGEWIAAASLNVGDDIRQADWEVGTVEVITFTHQPQLMYNLTVATAHTYFVGDGEWLVHNDCHKLQLLHSENRLNKSTLEFWGRKRTHEIVDSLMTNNTERFQIRIRPNGEPVVMQGNHRIKVLMDRGYDVDQLIKYAEVIN